MVTETELRNWHERLARHFALLRSVRQAAGGGRPIFALEHGLKAAEVQAVEAAVRAHVASAAPSSDHALPWIIYAAEIGYGYSGDEYWQTFEEQTPGWAVRGDRHWIRDRYREFRAKYGGAQPSGAWAEHFSIICWPITHAILPRDLQRQLARTLYELRHSFSAELFESPPRLGEVIAARSWNGTSRFQNFAQETNLVGQIAVALLLQAGELGSAGLLYPSALQRIGTDLERERRAREWLRGARRFAQERAKVRGLALARGAASASFRHPDGARAEVVALGIEPRLLLRPKASDASRWGFSLEIPDLSHLLFRFPKARDVLTGSRCVVAGASGRPLARGRCLHGAQRVTLSRWPREDEVLLKFEQTDAQLEYLLRAECLLRPGPCRLFRVASDGLAYESRSLRVRPGERYVLVTTAGSPAASEHVRPVELECNGVYGALIELPATLTADWEETLRCLGLRQAKTVEVWPAGLSAVVWDGEGHGEWLASERPCLAIQTDHPIAALVVSMGADPELSLELTSITPGEPIFVQLPQLPVGLHTVRVCTRSSSSTEAEPLGDLDVVMRIRQARTWSPGASPRGPLVVQLEPAAPSLEQLWEGQVEASVRGPTGRHVKCSVLLRETESGAPKVTRELPPLPFPVTPDVWRRHFEKHFRGTREAALAYDTARVCEIEISCEELGTFAVRCDREFTPLRWAIRRSGHGQVARLLDDSGDTKPLRIARIAFETPLVEEQLDPSQEYEVPFKGGLYVARRVPAFAAGIVIAPPKVQGLANLRCHPHIDRVKSSPESVVHALAFARTWGSARLSGGLISGSWRRDVLRAIAHHISQLIGGENWASAEKSANNAPGGLGGLKQAISNRRDGAGIGAALDFESGRLAAATCEERVQRLAVLATNFSLLPAAPSPSSPPIGSDIYSGKAARDTLMLDWLEAERLAAGLRSAGLTAVAREYEEHAERKRPQKLAGVSDPRWLTELALRIASDPDGVEDWAGSELRAGATRLLEVPTLGRAARFLVIATELHLQPSSSLGELYASWRWE